MFQFKQFTIHQERTPMKVGTDGVLLGAWANLEKATSILDIGTGTGLIALMSAQRNPTARIEALEIETDAYTQATENVAISPWATRIHLSPIALQNYYPDLQYDCILCNPPFFSGSTKAPDRGRTIARHNDTLPPADLIENVARLLKPLGNFCVILPTTEAQELMTYARNYDLYPSRITHVLPNPGKTPKRFLMEFVFRSATTIQDELVIELSRHQYSEAYKKITREFYLKME